MRDTLVKRSEIFFSKFKFFSTRAFIYFSFLLFPIWIQKTLYLNRYAQVLMMVFYILFMVGQWFLLGKEIDHRLRNYFRVNSSFDRVIYRLLLGMFFITIYFNILVIFPHKWIYNMFWVTWVILGLFYSWPTRGKIIRESVTTNFNEFKYLEPLEKLLLYLIIIFFIVSIPELPMSYDISELKAFFDPSQAFSKTFWNFMTVNYYPFKKYPELLRIAWGMHFYCIGVGSLMMIFYAMLRYFFSRRNALLGVFALISSWSFSKVLAADFGHSMSTTFSILWIWMILWVVRSSSYKVGLFTGLVGYWGAVLNRSFTLLIVVQSLLFHFVLLKGQTVWFRKKFFNYSMYGSILAILLFLYNNYDINFHYGISLETLDTAIFYISQKAIYSISLIGIFIILFEFIYPRSLRKYNLYFDKKSLLIVVACYSILSFHSLFFNSTLTSSFSLLWVITFFSLIPVEVIFQSVARVKSKRNLIYLTYILICLLDSHFEGRIKIFFKILSD